MPETKGPDHNYGESCQKPDLDEETFTELKNEFIASLSKSKIEFENIEKKTLDFNLTLPSENNKGENF